MAVSDPATCTGRPIGASPDIVEAILNGTQPAMLQLADLEGPFPIDWEQQHLAFGFGAKPSP
jgi:hypothetical protein